MSLLTLNSTLKAKMIVSITSASSLDDLKKTMLQMVNASDVVSSAVSKGWVDTINRNRQLVYSAFGDDVGDDLISLKYIGATKKEWDCCTCGVKFSLVLQPFDLLGKLVIVSISCIDA
jgi:hypothetical protein